jgi:hypothetical protein
MDRSDAIIAQGVRRIERSFKIAIDDIIGLVPATTTLDAAATNQLALLVSARASDLAVEFGVIFADTVELQQQVIDDLYKLYGVRFAPNLIVPVIGTDPELLAISSNLSQDLITSVTRRLTNEASRTFRLAALGPGARGLTASNAVHAALTNYKSWAAQASTILRTESLRLASIAANQSFDALNLIVPGGINKMWVWSQIERKEHAAISGQIRPRDGFFDVPLREGGIVKMRHPRDVMAIGHPSATVNCRCFVIPFPVGIPAPPLQ